jgi:hypothetical protein
MDWNIGQNKGGQRCATNASPALEHNADVGGRAMPHHGHYTLSGVILNIEDVQAARSGAPSPAFLRAVVSYDPETGKMWWRVRPSWMFESRVQPSSARAAQWNGKHAGKECFTSRDTNGYAQASIFDRPLMGHRVAWAIYYGDWPETEIDHIDRVKDNNRILNLRLVTRSENLRNRVLPPRKGNARGVLA